jgi:hypothetical protein
VWDNDCVEVTIHVLEINVEATVWEIEQMGLPVAFRRAEQT